MRLIPRRRQSQFLSTIGLTIVVSLLIALPSTAIAQRFATGNSYTAPAGKSPTAELLKDVGIDQHLDAQLPLDAQFRDESGNVVRLGDYFADKPVVLALVQYRCPMLCTQVLNGFLKTSQAVPLELGRDYHFVAISFDAREGSELSADKKKQYVKMYRRPGGADGFRFSDRRSSGHRSDYANSRIPLSIRSAQRPIRTCQRLDDRHARGPAVSLPLRH